MEVKGESLGLGTNISDKKKEVVKMISNDKNGE